MKSIPKHLKTGDIIEVRGIDWSTTHEWESLRSVERGTYKSEMRVTGYYIKARGETTGVLAWAGMLDVFPPENIQTKFVHYIDVKSIHSIKLLAKRDFDFKG